MLLSGGLGFLAALIVTDWSGGQWLQQLLVNTTANVLTYMMFAELVVAPICLHYQLGPALFAMEVWTLHISLVRAWLRMVYSALFMLASYFNPASCMLNEGMEVWEPGHITFAAFVMERVQEDRRLVVGAVAQGNLPVTSGSKQSLEEVRLGYK